jgi:2-amino-4-hydroxy-6-hydroxymethyldihydropteridine diphosphokinase
MISLTEAALSLGSNLGNRLQNIKNAIKAINNLPGTGIIKTSKYYETEPFGVPDKQSKYINCCIKIATELTPLDLLRSCLAIEKKLGRTREYRFCPRTIDIDILIYGNEFRNEENLTLPHPRLRKRAFVLVPLNDICENMIFGNVNFKQNYGTCDLSTVKEINF